MSATYKELQDKNEALSKRIANLETALEQSAEMVEKRTAEARANIVEYGKAERLERANGQLAQRLLEAQNAVSKLEIELELEAAQNELQRVGRISSHNDPHED